MYPQNYNMPMPAAGQGQMDRGTIPVRGQMAPAGGLMAPVRGQMAPVGGQMAPVGGQMAPVGGQMAPVGGQMAPVGGQMAPVGGQMAPVGGQMAPVGGQMAPIGGQIAPVVGQMAPVGGHMALGAGYPMMDGNVNALLAPLFNLDRAIVQQQVEPLEVFTGIETNNRYVIFNTLGQPIYYAYEESHPAALAYMGRNRPFNIRVIDSFGQQIMMLNSSVATLSRQVIVQIPVGRVMAVIQTEFGSFIPSFFVNDSYGRMLFTIRSPMNALYGGVAAHVNFHVMSGDQMAMVGMISKTYDGMFRAIYTDADTFWVSFPPTMDPIMKAMLIAAVFVVDFTFYEN